MHLQRKQEIESQAPNSLRNLATVKRIESLFNLFRPSSLIFSD